MTHSILKFLRYLTTGSIFCLIFWGNAFSNPFFGMERLTSIIQADTLKRNDKANNNKNDDKKHKGKHDSRITDKYIPLQLKNFPQRPKPLLEIGQKFLGTGTLNQGIKLPTGAVWQPYFIAFGTYRTGLQTFDNGTTQVSEWANRFDLFGNLYLTFTERLLFGFRPLDQNGRFTGVTFQPDPLNNGFEDELNFELTTLFFEGEFGELFPNLDRDDKRGLDFGFSVGRQLISFQEGLLINDNIDAVGITKINGKKFGAVNFRWTLLYGWNQINRTNLPEQDSSASMVGFFTETDWRKSTVAFDVVYINSNPITGDGIYAGLSAVQRLGKYNTSFRVVSSLPIGEESQHNEQGVLLFSEISWTPQGNHNLIYFNSFWGIKNFRSATRGPAMGGPLGRTGILFASVGLGRLGAAGSPLVNRADESLGGALGYQMFFAHTRKQLLFELGGRHSSLDDDQSAVAGGARFQSAFGRRGIIVVDGFAVYEFDVPVSTNEFRFGGRLELLFRF